MTSTEKSDTIASVESKPKRIQTDLLDAEQVGQFKLQLINADQFSCLNPLWWLRTSPNSSAKIMNVWNGCLSRIGWTVCHNLNSRKSQLITFFLLHSTSHIFFQRTSNTLKIWIFVTKEDQIFSTTTVEEKSTLLPLIFYKIKRITKTRQSDLLLTTLIRFLKFSTPVV